MQIVVRIAAVLEHVATSTAGLTLTEVARAVDLSPATTHRLLGGLAASDLVQRDPLSKRWRVGIGLVRIASAVTPTPGFGELVDPVLRRLRDRWQECFYFAVLNDGEVVCIRSAQTTAAHQMGVDLPLGRRLALHCSAAARAILAHLAQGEAERLLAGYELTPFTDRTLVDLGEILAELEITRERGFALCDQETELGVIAFATPVFGPPGEPPRSIGVIGPRGRLRRMPEPGLMGDLRAAAFELSRAGRAPRQLTAP